MANFKDICRKYTVLGQCYYNLETHEIRSEFTGKRGSMRTYKTPVLMSDFIKIIGDFMKEYSEDLYREENAWIGFENEDDKTILSIIYDNNEQ